MVNTGIDQVHEQLWIANITAARTHGMDEFDAIVTVCQDSIEDHVPDRVEYHFFSLADGPFTGYDGRHDYDYFAEAAEVILNHLENGDTILVHCHAGQSRSAATSIAALAVYEGTTLLDMYERVKQQRPQINPEMSLRDHATQFIDDKS